MTTLYSVGECPICLGAGDLLGLRSIESSGLISYCPSCGCAWKGLPDDNTIAGLQEVAPDGIALPTKEELLARGLRPTESSAMWLEDVMPFVR